MRVRILQPCKSSMQSGRAKSNDWLVEPEIAGIREPEPLMGWVSAGDTMTELKGKLHFKTREDAIAFAQKHGLVYSIEETKKRKITPRNYLDNFKWTAPKAEEKTKNS